MKVLKRLVFILILVIAVVSAAAFSIRGLGFVFNDNDKVGAHIEEPMDNKGDASEEEREQNIEDLDLEQNTDDNGSESEAGVTKGDYLERTTFISEEGKRMIKDPNDLLVLVNKTRNLPGDWIPADLTIPDVSFAFSGDSPRKYMRNEAAKALERLFEKAQKENIKILATSGYRSFETQKRIFQNNAKIYGEEAANRTSAYPGQSEHQTGLAMDITCAAVGYKLEESFEDTTEGKWLKENAAAFGFIIRYPKGKEVITGYSYEPWHIRYVGNEIASKVTDKGITLEDFFGALE